MKHPSLKIACAAATLTLAACADDSMQNFGQNPGNSTIEAELGATESRTAVDPTSYAGNDLGLLWTPTDTIGVFGNAGTLNVPFVNDEQSSRRANSTFTGSLTASEAPRFAYFPYSASAGTDHTALRGNLPAVHIFSQSTGELSNDYKFGISSMGGSSENVRFSFHHVFALLKVEIDASGTEIAGEHLEAIRFSVPGRQLYGEFTFSAADGSYAFVTPDNDKSVIEMRWADTPALASGRSYVGYISCPPTVRTDDKLDVSVVTESHQADFTMDIITDLLADGVYTIPLDLAVQKSKESWSLKTRPSITALSFTASANAGKILDKEVYSSNDTAKVRSTAGYTLERRDDNEFYAFIPYLNDRNLVPTFTVPAGAKVYNGETEVKSGVTAVDFGRNNILKVVCADGSSREYRVTLENTGLPVVVINQSGSGDFSDELLNGTYGMVVNTFLDFRVRGKNTSFVKDDKITIYNADGTLDGVTTEGGVRLRGNTTREWDKKALAIKFASSREVLGMKKHSRWCLLANRIDRSLLRNKLALEIANTMIGLNGDEGNGWNPHGKNVELVIDGRYVGNYFLCEQIKIHKNRININDEYDEADPKSFDECGYLLELDTSRDENCWFETKTPFPNIS